MVTGVTTKDPKGLNRAIRRSHHCTPTLDDVHPKYNGTKYFNIVDARNGYWNIKRDLANSLYTTFNSPYGRYKFLRLPFALIYSQDIFQKKADETFGDLPSVIGIAYDIVIYGCDLTDDDVNLEAFIEHDCKNGLRFNAHKYTMRRTKILFFGHIISSSGLRPDPQKVEVISSMKRSTSPADLQTFLGITQFRSRYPDITLSHPFRRSGMLLFTCGFIPAQKRVGIFCVELTHWNKKSLCPLP